jgi:hypothetical protein
MAAMSSEEGPVAWLRQRIRERLYLAQHAIELGNAAKWTEQSSGVLVTGEPTETDVWHGTWATGDSSLTRLMEANDPQDTIARCEAELAILDEHPPYADDPDHCARCQNWLYAVAAPWPCTTIRALAWGYRHRRGFPAAFADLDLHAG